MAAGKDEEDEEEHVGLLYRKDCQQGAARQSVEAVIDLTDAALEQERID